MLFVECLRIFGSLLRLRFDNMDRRDDISPSAGSKNVAKQKQFLVQVQPSARTHNAFLSLMQIPTLSETCKIQ